MKNTLSVLGMLVLLLAMAAPVIAADHIPVFIYHRFDEARYPSTNISTEIFRSQLDYLKQNQYQVLSLGEVVRRLQLQEDFPEKSVALCVDDAFSSFGTTAMPILREFGYPISLFVNTDSVGSSGYLDWGQLKDLYAEGVEIGNHTASHPYMVETLPGETEAEWRSRMLTDIGRARDSFLEHLGVEPELFAYPYGEYSEAVVNVVKSLGFQAAFAQQSGVIHSKNDLFDLPRFPMGGPFATLKGFVSKLKMKPMLVTETTPFSPVVAENPPELKLKLATGQIDTGRFNCFVQGDNSCTVESVTGEDGWYRVTAEQPLTGRRNKYTLTAPGKKGGWHWYSHLWINSKSPLQGE